MDLWTHAVGGVTGLNALHLLLAVVCLVVACSSPALRLASAVCGGFYLFGWWLDIHYFGPPPSQWNAQEHFRYYATFLSFDTVWLFLLILLRVNWAALIQAMFVAIGMIVLIFPFSTAHSYYEQFMAGLNVMFITALLLDREITAYIRKESIS